jgi:hypothetical protein
VTANLFLSLLTAIIGMVALSSSLIGYLAAPLVTWQKIILGAGGLMMIKPGILTDIVGIAIFAAILLFQMRQKKS